MKFFLSIISILLISGSLFAQNGGVVTPHVISYQPHHVFIPPGFDNNDKAEIFISGHYPSSCFKFAESDAQIDIVNKRIYIQSFAYYYDHQACLDFHVEYSDQIHLGVLPAGEYEIFFDDPNAAPVKAGNLLITRATTPTTDDFMYAPVTDLFVDSRLDNPYLSIGGHLTSSCLTIVDVKIIHRVANVVEVLPILENSGGFCPPEYIPWAISVKLENMDPSVKLVYVRSLNGQSAHKVVRFH